MRGAAFMVLAIALTVGPAGSGLAQDDEEEVGEQEEGDLEESAEGDDEGAEPGEAEAEAAAAAAASAEAERKWYFGLYGRYVFVPAFVLELFLEEAPTVGNFAPGLAVNLFNGDGGPSFQMGIGYTSFAFEDPFRASGDPVEDTEWVESDLGFVHLTGSVLWNTEIIERTLVFEYGLGIDIGIVTGELKRTEAYYVSVTGEYAPCVMRGVPDPFYCDQPRNQLAGTDAYDEEGAHYGVVDKSVPSFFALPILPHLALRYEPITGLALKFETALIPVVWFGISAAYAPF